MGIRNRSSKPLTASALAAALALAASPAVAENPYSEPDGSYIRIGGTVTTVAPASFLLDYGSGSITVEMDDWDSYGDAWGISDGDRVTVYGRVDDDLYELSTIEAGSVYVENLNTYFYASAADEESMDAWTVHAPVVLGEVEVIGRVTEVMPEEGRLLLETGVTELTVDTRPMLYDPLDDEGYQRVEEGDRISVIGDIDYDLIEGRELEATGLLTIVDESAS